MTATRILVIDDEELVRQTVVAMLDRLGYEAVEAAHHEVALAREAGVPVREDPVLAEALAALELDREVPPELYRAVAEALLWAWRLHGLKALPPGRGEEL